MQRKEIVTDYSGKTYGSWLILGIVPDITPNRWRVKCLSCERTYDRSLLWIKAISVDSDSASCTGCLRPKEPVVVLSKVGAFLAEESLTPQESTRRQLLAALRRWIVAQRRFQGDIARQLEIPRSAVSAILALKSNYSVGKLLDLWGQGVGGKCEFRLTIGGGDGLSTKQNLSSVNTSRADGLPKDL